MQPGKCLLDLLNKQKTSHAHVAGFLLIYPLDQFFQTRNRLCFKYHAAIMLIRKIEVFRQIQFTSAERQVITLTLHVVYVHMA